MKNTAICSLILLIIGCAPTSDPQPLPAGESKDVGLEELIEQPSDVDNWPAGGFLETTEIPKDAWGNDFVYELDPPSGKPFVIISYGADGEEGGEGDDADLYSTDAF